MPVLKVWKEDIQKAIVPIHPVMDAILIKLWAALFGDKLVPVQVQAPATSGLGPVSIPTVVSRRPGSKTPLVDTLVRRSSRLNPEVVDGVQVVKIKEPTPKRRKKVVTVIDLENPPRLWLKQMIRSLSMSSTSGLQAVECLLRSSRRMPSWKGMLMIRINDRSRCLALLLEVWSLGHSYL
jgi:hypothetical protein